MSTLNNQNANSTTVEFGGQFVSTTGGAVFYVGSAAQLATLGDTGASLTGRTYTTVDSALAQCVSGRGDTIYLLPGYTESIGAADAWASLGTKTDISVIGMGRNTNRPALTWTVAGSTMLFDTANFRLINCRLFLAGANAAGAALTVAAPITVSAGGCEISDCQIFFGFDADQIVTIGITCGTAADDFKFNRNNCYGGALAAPTTTFIQFTGCDRLQMHDTIIQGIGSATTLGLVQFQGTASLNIEMRRCTVQNILASSIHAVTGMAGLTGFATDCTWVILDDATLVGFVTPASMQFGRCVTSNKAGENGGSMSPTSA